MWNPRHRYSPVEDPVRPQIAVFLALRDSRPPPGVRVDTAENGRDAAEAVSAGTYDLVLMDVQMPVMDGLDTTRIIRRLPQSRGLPIVAMTANAMQSDREECLTAGMDDFLPKPIDAEQLLSPLGPARRTRREHSGVRWPGRSARRRG